jgi:hypothetical protein
MRLMTCLFALLLAMPSLAAAQTRLANVGPVFIDFGEVRMGARVTVPVTVRNLTTSTISFAGGGFNTNTGFLAGGGTCSGSLAAGGTCEFRYTFRPRSATGLEVSGSTVLSLSAPGSPSQSVPLNFVGIGVESMVDITPRSVDFGDTLVGETVTVPVTVTNPTTETVLFSGGGINPGAGFTGNGGTCGGSLVAGGTCQFNYSFTPNATGAATASTGLGVTTGSPPFSQSVPLSFSGNGVNTVGVVSVRPVGIDFGPVRLGSRLTVPFVFTNLSAVQINYAGGGFSPQGSDGGAFSGQIGGGAGCTGSTAAVGSTCSIIYRLLARELRTYNGTTSMSFSRPGATQSVPYTFTGRGVGTVGQVAARELDFGDVQLGTSQTTRVSVTNTTGLDLVGFVGGNLVSPFSATNNCPSALAPGATCEFTFGFTASTSSIGFRETQTSISFTNADGVQPVYNIRISAFGYDRVFADGFE